MRKLAGHYAPYLIGMVLLTVLFLPVIVSKVSIVMMITAGILLIAVTLYSWKEMRSHDRSLCEVCIKRMPLQPKRAAERRKYALLAVHLPPPVFITYLVAVLAVDGLLVYRYNTYPLWIGIHLPMLFLMYSHMTHRRLQPWCPNCGAGGIYHEERLPDKVIA